MLANKVVLVTGSTTGIGKAIAEYAIAQGASVMVHGRNEDRAQSLVQALGDNAKYTIAPLDDKATPEHLINATVEAFGKIDGLVNNAGIYPRDNVDTLNHDQYEKIMSINLRAPLFLSQAAIKQFRRQGHGGNIVNIGSINAYCGQDDILAYSISKGGLMTMTRNLAESLATENIRVNQLNAGWTVTETEHALKLQEGMPEDWQSKISPLFAPRGTLYQPAEVAPHAVFWLSDLSAPANGQVYELEQYPATGRNHINRITFCQDLT